MKKIISYLLSIFMLFIVPQAHAQIMSGSIYDIIDKKKTYPTTKYDHLLKGGGVDWESIQYPDGFVMESPSLPGNITYLSPTELLVSGTGLNYSLVFPGLIVSGDGTNDEEIQIEPNRIVMSNLFQTTTLEDYAINGDFALFSTFNGIYFNSTSSGLEPFNGGLSLGSTGFPYTAVYAISGMVNPSDERLKKNIKTLAYGLEEIMNLKPVSYQWKDKDDTSTPTLGFIAQELDKVVPEIVVKPTAEDYKNYEVALKNDNNRKPREPMLGVRYTELIPVLVSAIQELNQENENLKAKVTQLESLEGELNELKTIVSKLQSQINN